MNEMKDTFEFGWLANDDELKNETHGWLLALLSSRRHLIISLINEIAELHTEIEKLKDKQEIEDND